MDIWQDLGPNFIQGLGLEVEEDLGKTLYSMTDQEGYSYLKKAYNLSMSLQEIQEGMEEELRHFYLEAPLLRPGIRELLQALAGEKIPCYICSQTPENFSPGGSGSLGPGSLFSKNLVHRGPGQGQGGPGHFSGNFKRPGPPGAGPHLFRRQPLCPKGCRNFGHLGNLYSKFLGSRR